MRRLLGILTLLAVLFFAGCQDPFTSSSISSESISSDLEFSTDKTSYSLADDETIELTTVNNSSTQYFITEPSLNLTLEQKTDDGWNNLGTWYYVAMVITDPVPLGKEKSFHVSIDNMNEFFSLEEGQFRFQYILYSDTDRKNKKRIHTNSFKFVE